MDICNQSLPPDRTCPFNQNWIWLSIKSSSSDQILAHIPATFPVLARQLIPNGGQWSRALPGGFSAADRYIAVEHSAEVAVSIGGLSCRPGFALASATGRNYENEQHSD